MSGGGESLLGGRVRLFHGDARAVLAGMADASIDSVVTDPPYALVSIGKRFGKAGAKAAKAREGGSGVYARASAGFMGETWDTGETAFDPDFWGEVLRVLKPGGHVVAFGGTRTYHRLVCAIEDAGFEIRDQLAWIYGSGFPKSVRLGENVEAALGIDWFDETERERGEMSHAGAYFDQFDIFPKPALEPIVLARAPLIGTVAANVLAHGTGALNIDGCRIPRTGSVPKHRTAGIGTKGRHGIYGEMEGRPTPAGLPMEESLRHDARGNWPANVMHDGSAEVEAAFPFSARPGRGGRPLVLPPKKNEIYGQDNRPNVVFGYGDSGSAARFFYSAKADAEDRAGSKHPTIKPIGLMQWLCRLVTPPGGVVLDPFSGSGTTGEAAWREGFSAVLIEREEWFCADIRRRMDLALAGPATRKAASVRRRPADGDHGPLFGGGE